MRDELVNYKLVRGYIIWSVIWLMVASLVGLLVSVKFWDPGFLGRVSWLSWGRLRLIHVNGVAFGWWATATFGLIWYIVPRLTGTKLYSEGLARFTLWLWNIIIAASVVTLALGYNQGLEVAEMIAPIDGLIVVGFLLITFNVLATIFRRKEPQLYVSLWYLMAGLVWSVLNYILGNFVGYYWASGVNSVNIHGFYIHNLVGLLITPLGIATAYYFLPVAANAPIYSHALSLLGFWVLAFLYPWIGAHHYVFSPISDWVQTVAIVMSVLLILPVWTVIINFFGTLKGRWSTMLESPAVRFLILGAIFYLLTCLQGPVQSLRSMQQLIHFSDWVIGHAHLAVFGIFSLWAMAGIYHVWPIITGRQLYSRGLAWWHFWLTIVGFGAMMITLWSVGLLEGVLAKSVRIAFIEIISAAKPYWMLRSLSGGVMMAGFLVFAYNLWMTAKRGKPLSQAGS